MSQKRFRVIVSFAIFLSCGVNSINVCDNFESYYNINHLHCHNNTNTERNVTEIVKGWGFTVEEYTVTTEDGYIISVIRLYEKITQKKPLVFGHAELQNSLRFVVRDKKSPAYFFGKKGFDIYLVNFRGTCYSDKHVKMTCEDKSFWSFTFHELGYYDLCSVFGLVKGKSKSKAIYIGDSTGANAGLVYAIEKADEAKEYLAGMILYAPMAQMKNVKSYFKVFAMIYPRAKQLLDQLFKGKIKKDLIASVVQEHCAQYPYQMYICEFIKTLFYGDDFKELDPLDLPLTYYTNTESVSLLLLDHYSQLINCESFMHYDYGKNGNFKTYGQAAAPPYNLSAISIPVKIFVGENDWLATSPNAQCLYDSLPKSSKCGLEQVKCEKFNHVDFLQAKNIIPLLYEPTCKAIDELCEGKCQP